MGNLQVIKLTDPKEKASYIHQLIKDIKALEIMINDGLIEKSPIRIGAEQEFCLVDDEFMPKGNSLDVLKDIDDDHFTTQYQNYNETNPFFNNTFTVYRFSFWSKCKNKRGKSC